MKAAARTHNQHSLLTQWGQSFTHFYVKLQTFHVQKLQGDWRLWHDTFNPLAWRMKTCLLTCRLALLARLYLPQGARQQWLAKYIWRSQYSIWQPFQTFLQKAGNSMSLNCGSLSINNGRRGRGGETDGTLGSREDAIDIWTTGISASGKTSLSGT